ncbi:MAG TPA: UDP-N-acetylglucosamine 4-epimerase [Candidatus Andersenbacteria bacterium]|nr:UDP-N-acetylglucosamine 4-epimerase [Candidatus Andersenbacteria bacterium]
MIIIIGGSGFIGTRLGRLLTRATAAFNIVDIAVSRAFPKQTVVADVRLAESLSTAIPDDAIIINLAAEHRDDVKPLCLYDEVNVDGAKNVCTVAREKNVKTIIFTSTVAVYGFAPINTDESGHIAPFNDYGRTKYEAEQVYKAWQAEEPDARILVIVRPTVAFGEQNRGNVYNLLRQIASGKFVMVGEGLNRKSMAYVENLAAFLLYVITSFKPGVHIYNYVDKPDSSMNSLVGTVNRMLGRPEKIGFRLPFAVGYAIGKCFDALAAVTGKKFAISSIRVKKFCSDSVFETSISKTGFVPPVPLAEALERTVRHEFIEKHDGVGVFYTE